MPSYQIFAKFYDASMGDSSAKIEHIQGWIKQYHPYAKSLLELACGTGTILKGLGNEYTLTGLDLSREMLDIAKAKVPSAQLHHGDMANFELDRKFDVIICVFDSINHLKTLPEWQSMFQHVAGHLNPNGVFIFDFNTIGRFKRLVASTPGILNMGDDYLIMHITEAATYTTNWNIKVFENTGKDNFRLHHEDIVEISFPLAQVKQDLTKHFEILNIIDQHGGHASDESDRLHIICKRKRSHEQNQSGPLARAIKKTQP